MKKLFLIFVLLFSSFNVKANAEIDCLAKNIYHEARGQLVQGMFAVGMVTLNRVKDKRFPSTYCKVVTQGKTDSSGRPIKNKCHFSWYCDGKSDEIRNNKAYNKSRLIASLIYYKNSEIFDFTHGATHYHSIRVKPYWVKQKIRLVQIGDHIFYAWRA